MTIRDVYISNDILGPSKYAAQGKSTRTQSATVDMNRQQIDVPLNICQYYNGIELSADVMYVNNIPFLASISDNIHYGTADTIDNLQCPTLEAQINKVIGKYTVRGFSIKMIAVDIQFKSLKDRNTCTTPFNVVS